METENERGDARAEVDLNQIYISLIRAWRFILIMTLCAFVGMFLFVNVVTPKYTATTKLLLENQETSFTQPEKGEGGGTRVLSVPDEKNVASQVQVITSADMS